MNLKIKPSLLIIIFSVGIIVGIITISNGNFEKIYNNSPSYTNSPANNDTIKDSIVEVPLNIIPLQDTFLQNKDFKDKTEKNGVNLSIINKESQNSVSLINSYKNRFEFIPDLNNAVSNTILNVQSKKIYISYIFSSEKPLTYTISNIPYLSKGTFNIAIINSKEYTASIEKTLIDKHFNIIIIESDTEASSKVMDKTLIINNPKSERFIYGLSLVYSKDTPIAYGLKLIFNKISYNERKAAISTFNSKAQNLPFYAKENFNYIDLD
ncbi:hypothetical protein [Clostridium sp. 'White wine YQ']|uniref:hypothetical protein n=1 Tax=Clostridium sp. 'White wine YQ' TaxID=3027474 RepID=UPI00236728F1|nr:hypothetical protein [Clostridium sp. 'White wine YQ']MDD7793211.1 hypothetical protein [Clostridium sp. 'White wine YQ']